MDKKIHHHPVVLFILGFFICADVFGLAKGTIAFRDPLHLLTYPYELASTFLVSAWPAVLAVALIAVLIHFTFKVIKFIYKFLVFAVVLPAGLIYVAYYIFHAVK